MILKPSIVILAMIGLAALCAGLVSERGERAFWFFVALVLAIGVSFGFTMDNS